MTRVSLSCKLCRCGCADMSSEASVWNNIYMAALRATDLPSDVRASCMLAGYQGVRSMRYAPAGTLYKSSLRAYEFAPQG